VGSAASPKAVAVIGANYGDEGKGLVTDALSSPSTRVVRFNGGAQAAHTVHVPDGRSHVFHHLGSGSFAGASTHLSRFFVVHPILALREMIELKDLHLRVSADPRCPVTTPIDMMINQALETQRGDDRHGSCGIGFGETIERTERGQAITFADLRTGGSTLEGFFEEVVHTWAPQRCEELGLDFMKLPYHRAIGERFLEECRHFTKLVRCIPDANLADDPSIDQVVFEGAQGLALDQDRCEFPHVTRSSTGLTNVMPLLEELGIFLVQVVYVTRSYATRHGAGPLPRESEWNGTKIDDPTNVPNDWQGSIRFAPLAKHEMWCRIQADQIAAAEASPFVSAGLVVTCLDQYPNVDVEELAQDLELRLLGCSYGPNRRDLHWIGRP